MKRGCGGGTRCIFAVLTFDVCVHLRTPHTLENRTVTLRRPSAPTPPCAEGKPATRPPGEDRHGQGLLPGECGKAK